MGSTALTRKAEVHKKTTVSVKKKASMKLTKNVKERIGAGQVPQTSTTGDVTTDAFSRAIATSKDVVSPIARSLFVLSLVHSPPIHCDAKANAVQRAAPTSPPTSCDAAANAVQSRAAPTSNNVSPITMPLFQRSIAQARSVDVLDSEGSNSGNSDMEEVLVSDVQTFASISMS
jgi:hypothetical protein